MGNPEATASALILAVMITPLASTVEDVPKMLEPDVDPEIMIGAGAVLLVCSRGCFFQQALLLSIEHLVKYDIIAHSVVIEESFHFPSQHSIEHWLLHSFKHKRAMIKFIVSVFKKIAPAFHAPCVRGHARPCRQGGALSAQNSY